MLLAPRLSAGGLPRPASCGRRLAPVGRLGPAPRPAAERSRALQQPRRHLAAPAAASRGPGSGDVSQQVGRVLEGEVLEVRRSAVVVDLGGGLAGSITWYQVTADPRMPAEPIFSVGDRVKALVTQLDREGGRMTLSTQALELKPGDMLRNPKAVYDRAEEAAALGREARHGGGGSGTGEAARAPPPSAEGVVLAGVVKSITPFGAFITLLPGDCTGFLHISQISAERVHSMEQLMRARDRVYVGVLSVDTGRVTLSTKALEPTPGGDMLRNPQLVYDRAEKMAKRWRWEQLINGAIKKGTLVEGVVQAVKNRIVLIDLPAEPTIGDMLRHPQLVYDTAEEMAERWRQQRRAAPKVGDLVEGVVQWVQIRPSDYRYQAYVELSGCGVYRMGRLLASELVFPTAEEMAAKW
ncbi:hypothetical protein HYH03_011875 [Edaphochlamys debaryana]|uniref:S1 motif domain-containing protein n=1 Tax=Edaphochlamys debaryana TaxID=47281 RepID=A0A836BW04_9CHLO|nr:hypothetical protein HYH03_011875 [Edaphochlamys debaryana]|eukprot:KAG2489594.1 hypothetical protein HYH03_011875 [Edaphochlamys debaryana]